MRTAVRLDGRVTELVDETIAELRAIHDRLAEKVSGLSADQLAAQSGAESDRGEAPEQHRNHPDRKSTRLNSSHCALSRMPSSA